MINDYILPLTMLWISLIMIGLEIYASFRLSYWFALTIPPTFMMFIAWANLVGPR